MLDSFFAAQEQLISAPQTLLRIPAPIPCQHRGAFSHHGMQCRQVHHGRGMVQTVTVRYTTQFFLRFDDASKLVRASSLRGHRA
eukprot:698481-Hanusia_phi.AAC.1